MTVYSSLRRLVVDGEFPADRRVTEAELSDLLNVSRTPVREALSRLEGDGLVHAQGRGVRVRSLDRSELVAILEARAALEAWAAGKAADRVAAGDVAPARLGELGHLADEIDAVTRSGDLVAATRANRSLHQSIARLARNPAVDHTLDTWWDQIVVATRSGLREHRRIDDVDAEHRVILSALAAGDAAGARTATETHALHTLMVVKETSR